MQAVRKIVRRESIKSIFAPEEFGDRIDLQLQGNGDNVV